LNPFAAAALSIVLLHRADGGVVSVYPRHITSLHEKPPVSAKNKLITPEARCLIWLDDGKLLAVLETCDVVKQLLAEAAGK
jgi:hypothetical protein